MIKGFTAGDQAARLDADATQMRFFAHNRYAGGSMRFLKSAMQHLGLPGSTLRDPFLPLTDAEHQAVAASLVDFTARTGVQLPQR